MAEKEEFSRKFLFYDIVGAALIVLSLYFFIQAMGLAGTQNYVAGIMGTLIGAFIFSSGIGLIKVTAAAKASKSK